jgi:hypothetical protein
MAPADDFSDDYGWDDEALLRRQRRRKAKGKERFTRQDKESEVGRPRKNLERRPRRIRDWDDDYLDEE